MDFSIFLGKLFAGILRAVFGVGGESSDGRNRPNHFPTAQFQHQNCQQENGTAKTKLRAIFWPTT